MEDFIEFISQYVQLSNEAEKDIINLAKIEKLPKGEILLKEGKICKRLYFIAEGGVRSYLYQKGKDITHWVYLEQMIFTSWASYITNQPSSEYIETIENSVLISVSFEQWQELFEIHPELERFGRYIAEEQIALIDEFYKGFYFLSAKEKYDALIKVYPSILQKANLGYVASILGISQETLSRIRGK